MSAILQPVILEAGLNAIWRASNDGLAAHITHIALGDAGHTPTQQQTGLRGEVVRYPVAAGERLSPTQIHLTALADGDHAFWVREVGFILANGVCLAVWSHPSTALAYKAADVDLLLAYDLDLTAAPPDSVTIAAGDAGLNLAMAGELAALATAHVDGMLRTLRQQDQLTAIAQRVAALEKENAERSHRP